MVSIKIKRIAFFISFLIGSIFSNQIMAYVTTTSMRRLPAGDFTYGCLVGGRLYYRSLGTNITRAGSPTSRIIGYRFRFDPNFSVQANCQPKGPAQIGLYPDNPSVENLGPQHGYTAIGCTINTGTSYTGTTDGIDSNYTETNTYSYLPCPLDDYIWLLILPLGAFAFHMMRKRNLLNLT